MKPFFTLIFLAIISLSFAQVVEDSVVMGPNYTNDVFYSLSNGEVSQYSGSSWTVAFYNSAMSAAIMINEARGVELYKVTDDVSQFSSIVDTVGIGSWTNLHDVDSTWAAYSAFEGASTGSQSNYGWGEYNFSTHIISASRIFMLKTIDNNYYKVMVVKKQTGAFTYRYASLDNAFDTTIVVNVPDYLYQSYAYLNMDNHSLQSREPNADNWDFVFMKYHTIFQGVGYYPVTGAVSKEGLLVAEVQDLPANADYSGVSFKGLKNVIGSDWKSFNQATNMYTLADSLTFFVKTTSNEIYKLYFTAFEGGGTGKIKFNKELIVSMVGIRDNKESFDLHSVYPNPTKGNAYLVFSTEQSEKIEVTVFSLLGNRVFNARTASNIGLNTIQIDLGNLESGVYLVQISDGTKTTTQKLILNK
jgi:hypothetical protein